MREFVQLYRELDRSNKTTDKVAALSRYFRQAEAADAAWAVALLSGRHPKRVVSAPLLRQVAAESAGIPAWLFEECYRVAGDLAETISLLLPPGAGSDERGLAEWIDEELLPLAHCDEQAKRQRLARVWSRLDPESRLVWNKLITGGFRAGVSQSLVIRGLADAHGLPVTVLSQRLVGDWRPSAPVFERLISPATDGDLADRPYPFHLANPWPAERDDTLGQPGDYLLEWKWDGIRAQALRRNGASHLWSRGDEMLTDRFPEIAAALEALPEGTVLDGEILAYGPTGPRPFAELQTRITRKRVTRKLLEEVPAVLIAFDVLEQAGRDVRNLSLDERRVLLESLRPVFESGPGPLRIAERIQADTWDDLLALRDTSRSRGVEGLMLKRRESTYGMGRVAGAWWKWKVDPFTVDAVLVYAQAGHGRRAGLFSDYTFALWQGEQLVPVAKAYSGLSDAEIKAVDKIIQETALQKFGPVRGVTPTLVFELAFENIRRSDRHKSGLAVRFPRIVRWRQDKTIAEADTLERVLALLPAEGSTSVSSRKKGRREPTGLVESRQLRFTWDEDGVET